MADFKLNCSKLNVYSNKITGIKRTIDPIQLVTQWIDQC